MQEKPLISPSKESKKAHPLEGLDPVYVASWYCKKKLSWFVKEFWDVIIEEPLEWSPHMEVMCNEVQAVFERVFSSEDKLYDLIINIPPGTSKTTIATVMAPAWGWAIAPWLKFITFSYSSELSTEHAVKSRDIVMSQKYRLYFPNVRIKADENAKGNYKTTRKGQRFATSTGATVTGIHAHIIIWDDPLNPQQAAAPGQADLKAANRFFDSTIPTRKVDKRVTPIIGVAQRLDANDPSGHILAKKKKNVRLVCLPGLLTNDVKPAGYRAIYRNGYLDQVRMGPTVMEDLKIDLGPYGFSGQILQRPTPEGGLLWQRKWFVVVPDSNFPNYEDASVRGTDWDLAYTKDEVNAASAYISSFRMNNRIFLDDIDFRWLEFPELCEWMMTIRGPHYIEAKASGKSAKQSLTAQGITAIEVPVKGAMDKIARANIASPTAAAGLVYVRASIAERLFTDERQGILFFPKGLFADVADCLAQCLQRNTVKGARYMKEHTEEEDRDLLDEY